MATIKIKGSGTMELDYGPAKSLQEDWEKWMKSDRKTNHFVKVGTWSGHISDIAAIDLKTDVRPSEKEDRSHKINKEYLQERNAKLKLSPENRAKSTSMFELLYRAMTGQEANKKEVDQAKKLQADFFNSNPKRTLPNPTIFKAIIPRKREDISLFESRAMYAIELAVSQDIRYAK